MYTSIQKWLWKSSEQRRGCALEGCCMGFNCWRWYMWSTTINLFCDFIYSSLLKCSSIIVLAIWFWSKLRLSIYTISITRLDYCLVIAILMTFFRCLNVYLCKTQTLFSYRHIFHRNPSQLLVDMLRCFIFLSYATIFMWNPPHERSPKRRPILHFPARCHARLDMYYSVEINTLLRSASYGPGFALLSYTSASTQP